MEQSQHIKALYQKYLDNDYSEQELDELLEYFYNSGEHHELSSMIREELANERNGNKSHEAVQSLLAELDVELFEELAKRKTVTKQVKLWPRIVAVSMAWKITAAVTAITLGVWLYYTSSINDPHPELVSGSPLANDIAPGKNTATITLANGKTINLSDAKTGVIVGGDGLTYNDGSLVGRHPEFISGSRTRHATMLTAATPRGGTYQITLSDGTKVWLNADSKISFPSQFSGKKRKILLSGEAYFEVSKNKRMPFIVESEGQQVEVLGTHFNINAYADESGVSTTLLEGSVRVVGQSNIVTLLPNQQAFIRGSQGITVTQVNASETIAWKNNKFVFDDTDIRYIMRQIARWYNVDVIYKGTMPDEKFWGSVSRYENVSEVLKSLEQTGKIKFKIEGRHIYVSP